MSLYDTINCELTCPHCGVTADFEVDVRFSNANLLLYKIGSSINETHRQLLEGNHDFKIDGYTVRDDCQKDFFTLVSIENKIIKNIFIDTNRQGYLA